MRSSSNPAFRNLPQGQGQGYATFDRAGGMGAGMGAAYADAQGAPVDPGRAGVAERPITIDDVVTKTAITAGTAIVAGTLTACRGLYVLALPAFIVGFIVSLVLIFKPHLAKAPLVLLYSAAMGVALGGISGLLNNVYPGIALQAIVGTAGVFIGMLVVYKTGAVRVTPRFTKWLLGAMVGVIVLMLFNLVMSLFGVNTGLRDGGPLAIIFSLVVHRRGGVQPAARLRPGRPGHPGRRPGDVRLVHRVRPDDHAGLALHRDPAPAQLPARQLTRSARRPGTLLERGVPGRRRVRGRAWVS